MRSLRIFNFLGNVDYAVPGNKTFPLAITPHDEVGVEQYSVETVLESFLHPLLDVPEVISSRTIKNR